MKKQVSENPAKNREKSFYLTVITALLVTTYLASNIMSVRILSIGGLSIFDAGTITFPFAFMLGDALAEIWGFKVAKKTIILTFFCNILMVLFTSFVCFLPYPDYQKDIAESYNMIFAYVPRIIIASLLAFLAGELSNAFFLDKIRQKTGSKHLWLRTISSSAIGYVADSVIFTTIAFWGEVPLSELVSIIIIQYSSKLVIEALLGTPLVYALISYIKKRI